MGGGTETSIEASETLKGNEEQCYSMNKEDRKTKKQKIMCI